MSREAVEVAVDAALEHIDADTDGEALIRALAARLGLHVEVRRLQVEIKREHMTRAEAWLNAGQRALRAMPDEADRAPGEVLPSRRVEQPEPKRFGSVAWLRGEVDVAHDPGDKP